MPNQSMPDLTTQHQSITANNSYILNRCTNQSITSSYSVKISQSYDRRVPDRGKSVQDPLKSQLEFLWSRRSADGDRDSVAQPRHLVAVHVARVDQTVVADAAVHETPERDHVADYACG